MHFHQAQSGTRRSRLGATLHKLRESLEQSRQQEQQSLVQFVAWQARWAAKREEIARRLAQIDTEIDRMETPPATGPQLSVVGSTVYRSGVSSMGML